MAIGVPEKVIQAESASGAMGDMRSMLWYCGKPVPSGHSPPFLFAESISVPSVRSKRRLSMEMESESLNAWFTVIAGSNIPVSSLASKK